MDESAVEERFAHGAEGMVHHAIAERSGGDDAMLGVAYFDGLVAAWTITAAAQLALQKEHLRFQVSEKRGRSRLATFTPGGTQCGATQRGEGGYGVKQVMMFTWAWCALLQAPIRRPVASTARAACS